MDTNVAWFGGLLDGEGCFFARFYPQPDGRLPLTLRAEITLRSDDRAVLEQVATIAGGKVTDRPSRGARWNPTSIWRVSGLNECSAFVDKVPLGALRSKKQRDYATWREIVALYGMMRHGGLGARKKNQNVINEIEALCQRLKEDRAYAAH